MRVLHVLPKLSGGGAEGFVASLLPSLTLGGVRCGVMTVYPSETPFDDASRASIDIIDIERRGRYEAGFFPRMVSGMRAWRPDVVHTHMHNGKYWGRLAALLAGAPAIVHTVHNPCDRHRTLGEPIVDRFLNAASAAIVTFSQAQRGFLCKLEGIPLDKVVVIPNGIRHARRSTDEERQAARARLALSPDEFAIFVVGTLYGPKNQRLALDAFARLPTGLRARARLCIIGDGIDRSALERRAAKPDLDACVTFYGYRGDVRALLPGADLLCVPSLTEGMPLSVLEAMSAGVPVASTPWIGASDLLEDGQLGTISANWSAEAVAACLEGSMLDRSRARRLAARAEMRVRAEYDIDITAERYRRLYASLVARDQAA